jgi:hypothetical protein
MDIAICGFIDVLMDIDRESTNEYLQLFDIVPGFRNLLEEEKRKLPYSINLLDEIHANENAHSRILRKLLMFPETMVGKTRYPVLELFLKYLGHPFADLELIKPVITAEEARIDLLIRDRDYSIIIENKINGAVDQDEQLQRYVDKLKTAKVVEDHIYILYLTAEGGSPSESSFPEALRKRFCLRYREINFRYDVYRFLKESVLCYVAEKQESTVIEFLKSALHQYIDYLEGRFHLREGERMMRDKTRAYLEDKIGLNNSSLSVSEKVSLIRDNVSMLEEIKESLYDAENQLLCECVKKAETELCSRIQSHVINIIRSPDFGRSTSRIQFYPKGWKKEYCISIVFEDDYSKFFLGIENKQSNEYNGPITDKAYEQLKNELGESDGPSNHWVYAEYIVQDRESVIDYFVNNSSIVELSDKIIHMADNQTLLEILK